MEGEKSLPKERLIGLLSHTCKVVRAGRSFLRRLIDLSTIPKHLDHFVRLNADARSDIEWWVQYCEYWNGIQMMRLAKDMSPVALLTSDASGNWGCGAYAGSNWFMLKWVGSIAQKPYHCERNGPYCYSFSHLGSYLERKTV